MGLYGDRRFRWSPNVKGNTMTTKNEQALMAQLEQLKRENEALKQAKTKGSNISFKVSEKGAVSVYGLGRFPVTLYRESWLKLSDTMDKLKTFMVEHKEELDRTFNAHQLGKAAVAVTAPVTVKADADLLKEFEAFKAMKLAKVG